MINRLRDEAGYSLVEVVVSMMILTVAILPMVGMFDAGLRAASTSSNYDKARSLANANLESVKTMKLSSVRSLTACPKSGESGLTCSVTPTSVYVDAAGEFQDSGAPTDMVRVKVTVGWGDGNTYSTFGLVAR